MSTPALKPKHHPYINVQNAADVVRVRWALRDATEAEVKEEFSTIPLPEGLEALAQIRKMTETISALLNERIGREQGAEGCTTCGGPPKKTGGLWVMQGVDKDSDTGLFIPYRFCSVMCVRERNRKRLMPEGASTKAVDGTEMGDIK